MTAYRTTLLVALVGAALTQACSDSGGDIAAPDPIPTPVAIVSFSGEVDPHIPEFGAAIGDVNNKGEPEPPRLRAARDQLGRRAGPVHEHA